MEGAWLQPTHLSPHTRPFHSPWTQGRQHQSGCLQTILCLWKVLASLWMCCVGEDGSKEAIGTIRAWGLGALPLLRGALAWRAGRCGNVGSVLGRWTLRAGSSSPSDPRLLNRAQMEQAHTEDLLCEGSLGGDSEWGEDSVGVSSTLPGAVP